MSEGKQLFSVYIHVDVGKKACRNFDIETQIFEYRNKPT